jgi:hypothetical protein
MTEPISSLHSCIGGSSAEQGSRTSSLGGHQQNGPQAGVFLFPIPSFPAGPPATGPRRWGGLVPVFPLPVPLFSWSLVPVFIRPQSHPESAPALSRPPPRRAALYLATPATNPLRTQRSAGTRDAGQFHIRESSHAASGSALPVHRELHESSPGARQYRLAHCLRHAQGCADDMAAPRAPLPRSSSPRRSTLPPRLALPTRSTRSLRRRCLPAHSALRSLVPLVPGSLL